MARYTQLLLVKDVDDLGRSGEIVKVKPGYARNYLVPKGCAVVADRNALRMQDRLQEERSKRAAEDRSDSEKLAKELNGKTIKIISKVDQEGHMYGSVSASDISKLVETELNVVLSKKGVKLKHPIKKTGVYAVVLGFKEGVTAEITVKVLAEGAVEEPEGEDAGAEEVAETEEA